MLRKTISSLVQKIDRMIHGHKDFVVISNNCWGAEIYRRLGKEYNTPFVGLYLHARDYIELLSNFDHYMNLEPDNVVESRWVSGPLSYPVMRLGVVEIHFLHYKTWEEAQSTWARRRERMKKVPRSRYFFKFDDRDGATLDDLRAFEGLPLSHKVLFHSKKHATKSGIVVSEESESQTVPDGLQLYGISYRYMDPLLWVEEGEIRKTWLGTFKFKFKLN